MSQTPVSKILTRRQRQELCDVNKFENAPQKESKKSKDPIPSSGTDSHVRKTLDMEDIKCESISKPCAATPYMSVRTSTTIKTKKSTASSVARRKQLEFEAAAAKAKIQMELIDKQLEVDLAKVDSEVKSQITNYEAEQDVDGDSETRKSSYSLGQSGVEKWLDHCTPVPPVDNSIQQLACTLKEMMNQPTSHQESRLLSRLATPRDLPVFSGDCIEWLHFKSAYDESTRICKFSETENLWRLRKALRGEAKESVTDLLIGNTPPSAVMEALQLRFGRSDIIIHNITSQVKKLPPLPTYYQQELINFSVKINNCVATIQALNQVDYLRSPELATAVISKLPSTLIGKWTDYAYSGLLEGKSKLELLAMFLKLEAERLSIVGCIQPRENKKPLELAKRTEDGKSRYNKPIYTTTYTEEGNMCKFCQKGSHLLPDCRIFKRAMRKDKWRYVKMHRLCYCCLITRHDRNSCPAPMCDIDSCGLAHHRLLHWTKPVSTSQPQQSDVQQEPDTPVPDATVAHVDNHSEVTAACQTEFMLLKVVPVKLSGPKGVVHTYALLDDGASISMIDSELADNLGLKCEQSSAIKFTDAFGLEVYQSDAPKVSVHISGSDGVDYDIKLRKTSKLKLSVQNLSVINKINCAHLTSVKDFVCKGRVVPRVLIGEDNYFLIAPHEIIHGDKNSPYASRCLLGWAIHGYHGGRRTHSGVSQINHISHLAHSPVEDSPNVSELNDLIKQSFDLDSIGILPLRRENTSHVRAMQILDDTSRQIGDQWEVGLPLKNDVFKLPDTYNCALSRLKLLFKKFAKDKNYGHRYKQEIQKLFDSGYARELDDSERSVDRVWYIPHFGVQNPNKPNKLRLVFDAAAKVEGFCLNDYLLTGPDLYNSLLGIMFRFRENKIVIIGDIKDMFLRVKIRPEDRHLLRFLWQESPDSQIKICAMNSLNFGATCSPFIAQYIKNKNALKYEDLNPQAVQVIINDHYMDDCLVSTKNEETAIKLIHDITAIHKKGGFEIRGWSSNSKPVLTAIPADALATSAKQFKDGVMNTSERTLGLMWHPSDDSFGFKISLERIPKEILDGSTPPTKAKMLSIIMSVYDLHGFLSPFIIKSKIILQNVHRSGVNWKCHIQPDDHARWMKWLDELQQIQSLRIPRWYIKAETWTNCYSTPGPSIPNDLNNIINTQIHIFSDASIKAYAAVVYWRFIRSDGSVCVCFAASKSRVTPLRPISIPRLELQGALLAARLADTVQKEHKDVKADKRFFWTDSSTVLQWIRSDPRSYKPFVAHRLGEIDELTSLSEWRYVPSSLNVADIATKEDTPPLRFSDVWFQGPTYLRQPEDNWPKDLKCTQRSKEATCEERGIHVVISNVLESSLPDEKKFSSWLRLLRITANVLLFIKRCRSKNTQLSVDLMNEAELFLLKKSQQDSFSMELTSLNQNKPLLSNSRLLNLTPILDDKGLLRVGGRIDKTAGVSQSTISPIILDGSHHITRLLVEYYHRRAFHGANELVVNEMRQRYWVVKLRPTVRAVAARCLFCKFRRAAPQPQRMANLPAARLQHHRVPFTYTGVDFFGPMEVTVGRRRHKRYGVLFTCLTIRAIHLELAESLSTDSTIMALRRMISRRGAPSVLYSDNGTNFRGADAELKRSLQELNFHKLREDGTIRGIEWRFIPPGAPEMGGAWERMIRTVKTALKVVLKERAPHPETLITFLLEVEALVNSRPITHVSADPNYPEALTPNHFLIGTSSNSPHFGKYDNDSLCIRKQWRVAQRLADMFWSRWLKEYLPTLLPRQKWTKEERALRDGDYVLLVEPNLDRGSWRHGVVSATHAGDDGRVRIVDVRTRTGLLRRPVTRVALLTPVDN